MMNLGELEKQLSKLPESKVWKLKDLVEEAGTVHLLGNGGSSAICSHIAQDYTKMLLKPSYTLDNVSQLSCLTNDYGHNNAYFIWLLQTIKKNSNPLIVLISSSGRSENILNAAKFAVDKSFKTVILSGFEAVNPLRSQYGSKAEIDYWVDSTDYGIVECLHQVFLHAII